VRGPRWRDAPPRGGHRVIEPPVRLLPSDFPSL
jgi:hypothetical protein